MSAPAGEPVEVEPSLLRSHARSETESWRLSRIEEELGKLDIECSNMAEGGERMYHHSPGRSTPASPMSPRSPGWQSRPHSTADDYNKIYVRPLYQNVRDFKLNYKAVDINAEQAKQGVEKITGKYDSLDKMRNNYQYVPGREKTEAVMRPKPPNRTTSFSKDADVRPFSGRLSQLYDSQENGIDNVFEEEGYWDREIRLQEERIDQLIVPYYQRNFNKARSLPRDVSLTNLLRASPTKVAGIHGRRSVHLSNDFDYEQNVPSRVESTPPLIRAISSPQNSQGSPVPAQSRGRSSKVNDNRRRTYGGNDSKSPRLSRAVSAPPKRLLTEQDVSQVSLFYQSHKTNIFVSKCQARLYFSHVRTSVHVDQDSSGDNGWKLIKTGVPVLVLDTGESRRQRRMYIVVAERGTGFALWRDTVNHLTNYKAPTSTFHTMHLSSDHSKVAGLRFDDMECACDFFKMFHKFTANPQDAAFNISKQNGKSKGNARFQNKKGKSKLPNKSDISHPVCFTHVTMMDRPDAKENRQTLGETPVARSPKLPKQGILKRSIQV